VNHTINATPPERLQQYSGKAAGSGKSINENNRNDNIKIIEMNFIK